MKEVKHYICEVCGTEYKDKLMAQKCEKNHKCPAKIVKCKHYPVTQNAKGYPAKIDVLFSDGETVTYSR